MKAINYSLLISLFCTIFSSSYPAEGQQYDERNFYNEIKRTCDSLPNHAHPELPTQQDVEDLNRVLFPKGEKLPNSLIAYHLMLGNLVFAIDEIPTVHGGRMSELYHFIKEAHMKRDQHSQQIPAHWIPFAQDNGRYICISLTTGEICYFHFCPFLKIEAPSYPTLSAWLKERLFKQ